MSLACLLSLLSLSVPGVLPLRNRNCFWPRSLSSFFFSFPGVGRSDLLFYLYSSAVVILLHEEERKVGNVPTFALIFGPLRAGGGGEVGWLSSPSLSFPSQEVHSHDICCIQSADLSSPFATAAAMRAMEAAAAFSCTAVWRPLSMIPAVRQLPLGRRSRWLPQK